MVLSVVLVAGASTPAGAAVAGGVRGVVLDRLSRPLAGAALAVRDPRRGTEHAVAADGEGRFRIAPLEPGGGYVLTAAFPGMTTLVTEGIAVHSGRDTVLTLMLDPAVELKEVVRVVARPPALSPDATTETRLSAEFIEVLPILGRNYQDLLVLAPGVSDIDEDGNPNIHGARDTDVRTLLDGVSTVDPYTGKVGQQLNIEAIQELEVKTAGASAEFGRAQGGFVNVITKSGGNEFEGTFKFLWRGSRLDRDGAGFDDPRLHGGLGGRTPEFDDFKLFLSAGGPLRRDRAWYFATIESIRIEEPVNLSGRPLILGTSEKRGFAKLTWDATAAHRLALSATLDPVTYDGLGIDAFTASEAGYTLSEGGLNLVLKHTAIFGPGAFLETTAQRFETRPERLPTTNPDTNGNGILFHDRNGNGLIEAVELDPGEDYDRDGAFDVRELDRNLNQLLEPWEDLDGDGRWSGLASGCEGENREDRNCNGVLDAGEDRNGNGRLDDRPFPHPQDVIPGEDGEPLPAHYPYGRFEPIPPDRAYTIDAQDRISGAYFLSERGERGRLTLRQDLTVFVPERRGQHDLKAGFALESERFAQDNDRRPVLLDFRRPLDGGGETGGIGAILAADGSGRNRATGLSGSVYVQDTWRPRPNLSLGLGLRFDREVAHSRGYSPFEPAAERRTFERINALAGAETSGAAGGGDDGIVSHGIPSDPLLPHGAASLASHPDLADLAFLRPLAIGGLTQSYLSVPIVSATLADLFPDAVIDDPVTGERRFNYDVLRTLGYASFTTPESFAITNANLAPRLAVSWDPGSDGRSRLFATWGRFYDKLFLQVVAMEQGPETVFRYYQFEPAGVDFQTGEPNNQLSLTETSAPTDIYQVDRALQTPYADELTAGFEREITPELALSLTYIDRRFRQQVQDVDVNHRLRYGEDGAPLDVFGAYPPVRRGSGRRRGQPDLKIPDGRPDLYIENYFFNRVMRVGNFNEARYRGIEAVLRRRLRGRWQFEGSYTYARAVGAAEEFLSSLGNDPSVVQDEFGYLEYDQRHLIKIHLAAYLPRDWQVGGILTWSSGLPYSVVDRFFAFDNVDYGQLRTFYGYVDHDEGGTRRFVLLRRNSERNPAFWNLDLLAQKAVVIGRVGGRLFVSAENVFNTDTLRVLEARLPIDSRDSGFDVGAERRFGRRLEIGFAIDF
jgi:hypothetical protein